MDTTRAAILALIIVGATAPLLGALLAVANASRTLKAHERDVKVSQAILKEWRAESSARRFDSVVEADAFNLTYHSRFLALGLPVPSRAAADDNATGDLAVSRVLRLLARGQGWNVSLIVLGVFASTAAAIWSLWLPTP
ncbi:hypothetical protein [Leifsonia xyli]|uniref:hypothetical protein n=1 Tax=Leifsonia xyli TaxID=1575 RepID=UPI0012FDBBAD